MSGNPREGPEITEIETALRALAPAPSQIDRDRLMFEAGARSRPAIGWRRRFWPCVAAGLAAVVAGESTMLLRRPAPRVVERVVVVREPSAPVRPPDRPIPPAARETVRQVADPLDGILAGRWETAGGYQRRLTIGGAFVKAPGALVVPVADDRPDALNGNPTASVGDLRRMGFEELLNPGGRS